MDDAPKHPAIDDPPALDYAEPAKTPGHVDDLLKINIGCFFAACLYLAVPLGVAIYVGWRDAVPVTRWIPAGAVHSLTIPLGLGLIWYFSPQNHRWAANRQQDRWELRLNETLVEGELLEKVGSSNRRFAGTVRVRFRIDGKVITATKPAGSRAFHHYKVGESVPVAVDPGHTRRWRLLEAPPETESPDF